MGCCHSWSGCVACGMNVLFQLTTLHQGLLCFSPGFLSQVTAGTPEPPRSFGDEPVAAGQQVGGSATASVPASVVWEAWGDLRVCSHLLQGPSLWCLGVSAVCRAFCWFYAPLI